MCSWETNGNRTSYCCITFQPAEPFILLVSEQIGDCPFFFFFWNEFILMRLLSVSALKRERGLFAVKPQVCHSLPPPPLSTGAVLKMSSCYFLSPACSHIKKRKIYYTLSGKKNSSLLCQQHHVHYSPQHRRVGANKQQQGADSTVCTTIIAVELKT